MLAKCEDASTRRRTATQDPDAAVNVRSWPRVRMPPELMHIGADVSEPLVAKSSRQVEVSSNSVGLFKLRTVASTSLRAVSSRGPQGDLEPPLRGDHKDRKDVWGGPWRRSAARLSSALMALYWRVGEGCDAPHGCSPAMVATPMGAGTMPTAGGPAWSTWPRALERGERWCSIGRWRRGALERSRERSGGLGRAWAISCEALRIFHHAQGMGDLAPLERDVSEGIAS